MTHRETLSSDIEGCVRDIVDASFRVHKELGPRLLESAYEQCLVHDLRLRGRHVQSQVSLPVHYLGKAIEAAYRIDLLVNGSVVVEIKATDAILQVHRRSC